MTKKKNIIKRNYLGKQIKLENEQNL